ncbi:MAG TPA: DUF167 domain-containing protein [Candidatus Dependentiae bacterium]|jgi:uncharacterized protein YggU (UPF0235/DUF167 family)|nr:DUF167 domain-containing protein [Candidatus Dependentiae bacterium]
MSLQLIVKVVPSSGKHGWTVDKSGQLKCFLKNPPEKGLANKELVKLLANALRVPQDAITLVGGLTSRTKRLLIETSMTLAQVEQILGIERQQSLL